MSQPYDHIKQAGVVADHIGEILGSGVGLVAGIAPAAYLAYSDKPIEDYWPALILPSLISPIGGRLGALFDSNRLNKKVEGKSIEDYRYSKDKLKELGLSKEQIDEILKYPLHTKKAALKQALEVHDKEFFAFRPISATIGKVLADPSYEKVLGIPTNTASLDNPEIAAYLKTVEKHPALKNVSVHLGSTRMLDKLMGIWKNENSEFVDKLYASATLPYASFWEALARADHFDPNSNSITLYHDSPAVLAHELGHALDYNTAEDKDLWRQLYTVQNPVPQEYLASNLAINKLTENYFINKANFKNKQALLNLFAQAHQLEKALATYSKVYGNKGLAESVKKQDSKAKTSLEFFLSHPKYAKKVKALMKKHKIKVEQI